MRRLVSLFALVVSSSLPLSSVLHAQQASSRATRVRTELLRNEDGWAAALVKRDAAYFERMLAPGFVYTEDDKLMSRDDVLRSATSISDTVTAAHNEGMVVHLFGRSTGVVTGFLIVEGRSGGNAYTHRYRFTDTWVEQPSGRWRIVAAQDYLVPAKKR